MFRLIFCTLSLVTISAYANNGLVYSKIKFPIGITKLNKSVMKQASNVYNKLPERNFARVKLLGEGEDDFPKSAKIKLSKKRAFTVRDFFLGIGCSAKNVKLDLAGMPSIILLSLEPNIL